MSQVINAFRVSYSYSQIQVLDASVSQLSVACTDRHFAQGFCRGESEVVFFTLDQWGRASVRIFTSACIDARRFHRLIMVPFFCPTGIIIVQGPEDGPQNQTAISQGNYYLWAGQKLVAEREIEFDLYLEKLSEPAVESRIVVRDPDLAPEPILLEQ
jgi:hypothetical protein